MADVTGQPEVVPMVLNRDHVMRTTRGHSIEFKKDQPTNVPLIVYADAIAIGATRHDGKPANVIQDDKVVNLDPAMRKAKLLEVLKTLQQRNGRDDFTGNGMPSPGAVNLLAGDIGEKYVSREINAAWKEMTVPGE